MRPRGELEKSGFYQLWQYREDGQGLVTVSDSGGEFLTAVYKSAVGSQVRAFCLQLGHEEQVLDWTGMRQRSQAGS